MGNKKSTQLGCRVGLLVYKKVFYGRIDFFLNLQYIIYRVNKYSSVSDYFSNLLVCFKRIYDDRVTWIAIYIVCFLMYCKIIIIRWKFHFMYFVGRAIHKFNISIKYLFTLVIYHTLWNLRIKVSTNMSSIVKLRNCVPMKLNDFTVGFLNVLQQQNLYAFKNNICCTSIHLL